MKHQPTTETKTTEADVQRTPRWIRWYRRPTIRALKTQVEGSAGRKSRERLDERENDETRLPDSEAVHLGGLVLTEAFSPSTVSSLYATLEHWPSGDKEKRREWLEQLTSSRGGGGRGWRNLGVVRPPSAFLMGEGYNDANLPSGVKAVWLHLSYETPALAMVVATFTLSEDAGDLSDLLRQDYRSRDYDVKVSVIGGRLAGLRARTPWSRPARYRLNHRVSDAANEKRKACQDLMREHEEACSRWFFERFRGRFASAEPEARPILRLIFTKDEVPYAARRAWFRPIGLDFAFPLWRSTEPEGWWLAEERWPHRDGGRVMTLAARRIDVSDDSTDADRDGTNWSLTQRFGTDQAPLAARLAVPALLAIYSERLADLRDQTRKPRLVSRPVSEARILESYLVGDGLDAATITSDLRAFTREPIRFAWGVPTFTEYQEHLSQAASEMAPMELVPSLCDRIAERAARLASDTEMTIGTIRASAELRQAVANTRLQRLILSIAVVAVLLALISLLTA